MKITIIGAGSLGCLYGGIFATHGHDVYLIHHREEYAKRLDTSGIRIDSPFRDDLVNRPPINVTATTDGSEVPCPDVCIFLVKANQTKEAARMHQASVRERTVVLSLQNGLRNRLYLDEIFPQNSVLGGVTYQGAITEESGSIRHTGNGPSIFGGANTTANKRVEELLTSSKIPYQCVVDPRPYIWDKQLLSLAIKPLAGLTRLPNHLLVQDDDLIHIMDKAIQEAQTVANERGIELMTEDPLEEIVTLFDETRGKTGPHKSSLLQDIEAERKTEIDEINGAIVEFAKEIGVEVPMNTILTSLVRALERSYLAKSM